MQSNQPDAPAAPAANSERGPAARLRALWRDHLRPLVIVLFVLLSFRSAVADWYDVPTGSMKPTIIEGDRILVNKLAYDLKIPFTRIHIAQWADPQRSDVVILYSPTDGKRLVKRVVGLPGDTVELRGNILYINGSPAAYRPLDQPTIDQVPAPERASHGYAAERLAGGARGEHPIMLTPAVLAARSFGPVVIPAGHYWVMGDNRDESADSRYFGFVPRERIVGRARSIVFSLNDSYVPRGSRFFKRLP